MLFQIIVQAYQIYDISVQDTISCTTRPLIQLRRDFKLDMIVKRRFLTTGYLIMFEYHDDISHIHSLPAYKNRKLIFSIIRLATEKQASSTNGEKGHFTPTN